MKFFKTAALLVTLFLSVQADLPYHPIEFPRDGGGHFTNTPYESEQMLEWWYYNGKLESTDGEELSYECAIFQMKMPLPTGDVIIEHWSHLIVADQEKSLVYFNDANFTPETANVSNEKLDINYGDQFQLKRETVANSNHSINNLKCAVTGVDGTPISVDLFMMPIADPLMVNGTGQMDMPDGGNTYYYSETRAVTSGTVTIADKEYTINPAKSTSWMDHQWGDFFPMAHGWDWFSVRLENGLDALIFVHTATDGTPVGGQATLIMPDGSTRVVPFENMNYEPMNYWTSPLSGKTFALSHLISIPEIDLNLEVLARFAEQDIDGMWEGLCDVNATYRDEKVKGFSFMELVISPLQ